MRRSCPPKAGQAVTSGAKTGAISAAQESRWGPEGGAGEPPGLQETVGDGGVVTGFGHDLSSVAGIGCQDAVIAH